MSDLPVFSKGDDVPAGSHGYVKNKAGKLFEVVVVRIRDCEGCVCNASEFICGEQPLCSGPTRSFVPPDTYALMRLKGKA